MLWLEPLHPFQIYMYVQSEWSSFTRHSNADRNMRFLCETLNIMKTALKIGVLDQNSGNFKKTQEFTALLGSLYS